MKKRFILCALVALSLFSCKDNKVTTKSSVTEAKAENRNTLSLSNYSDENWKSGVGITYKMFLTDYSKEKEELLKTGKEIVLADSTSIPYIGYEVAGNYIHILLNEIPTKYVAAAEYPNVITVK
jgi:hypothetical protein